MKVETRLAFAATLAYSACFNPQLQEAVPCAEGDQCPPGQSCVDGLCFDDGNLPDGGVVAASATLSALIVSSGELVPPFDPQITDYSLPLDLGAAELVVTPTATEANATISIGGVVVDSGAESEAQVLRVGDNVIAIDVASSSGETATYIISIDRGALFGQRAYAKASNTDSGDRFGAAVAIDGNTMVVGAPFEDSSATSINGGQGDVDEFFNAGAAYVYVRNGDSWAQQAYLKPSNMDGGDQFGTSVAISADTIAIGSPAEDSGNPANPNDNTLTASGAVYVFVRTNNTWTQQAYLKDPTPDLRAEFGAAVALEDNTLAIGAYREPGGGAVHVFTRSGAQWAEEARLVGSNTEAGDFFGVGLALYSNTLAVGATLEDSNATGVDGNGLNNSSDASGAAYVFTRVGTTWSEQAYLKASNTGADDAFGSSLALAADTLVIGAIQEGSATTGVNGNQTDNSAANAGAVYAFERTGAQWEQTAYLKASNTDAGDRFGAAVAVEDGVLVVAATFEASSATGVNGSQGDNGNPGSGAAYLFARGGAGVWAQYAYIKPSNTGGQFGSQIGLSDSTIVVGAETEDSAATGVDGIDTDTSAGTSGAAFVFE